MARKNIPANRLEFGADNLKLYTLSELTVVLGISREALLGYVKTGDLKANKIAGKWRIRPMDVEAFLDKGISKK